MSKKAKAPAPKPGPVKTPVNDIPGACLVVNPETGESECVYVTKTECQKLHGTFIGGPCGGL